MAKHKHTPGCGNGQAEVAYTHGMTGGNVNPPCCQHDDDQKVLPGNLPSILICFINAPLSTDIGDNGGDYSDWVGV